MKTTALIKYTIMVATIFACSWINGIDSRADNEPNHVKADRRTVVWSISDIKQGATIKSTDLKEVSVKKGKLAGLIYCQNEAIGQKAKHAIEYGQVISKLDIVPLTKKIPCEQCRERSIVVAKNLLKANKPMKLADLQPKSISAFDANSTWISRSNDVLGFVPIHPIAAGTVLSPEMLRPLPETKKDSVKLRSVYGADWRSLSRD